jgi:hypothetical protein
MSDSARTQMHINLFIREVGHHEAAWRLPESDEFASLDLEHYCRIEATAERGRLDSIFSPTRCP